MLTLLPPPPPSTKNLINENIISFFLLVLQIRILLPSSKNSEKHLDAYSFVTSI
jgi:hypothetical protein